MTQQHVASKKRVADHGEVYTRDREVHAMLDLVSQKTERIDSRFLEPACGTGNFLVEVLARKLCVVEARYGRRPLEYKRNAVLAISNLYGIDILQDNVERCRVRLFGLFDESYTRLYGKAAPDPCREAVRLHPEKKHQTWQRTDLEDGRSADCFCRMLPHQRQPVQAA